MNWYRWRWWRFAYAPEQKGWQVGHGYHWRPVVFGLYFADFPGVLGVMEKDAELATNWRCDQNLPAQIVQGRENISREARAVVEGLIEELLKAEDIIKTALVCLQGSAKQEFIGLLRANNLSGVGPGDLRVHEREAVLARAQGVLS